MFTRYGIFYTLPSSPLAEFSAAWLGWNLANGSAVEHPKIGDLDVAAITNTPRKYGVHGTLKPPFVIADGQTEADLGDAVNALCRNMQSVVMDGLEVTTLGRFLALCPVGDAGPLNDLAAQVVRGLDDFRAPMTQADLARRRSVNLTPAQDEYLRNWGYPHVMDAFRFHITLTGKLNKRLVTEVKSTLDPIIKPLLPKPFVIDNLTLVGQRTDGMFVQIQRYPLAP